MLYRVVLELTMLSAVGARIAARDAFKQSRSRMERIRTVNVVGDDMASGGSIEFEVTRSSLLVAATSVGGSMEDRMAVS